MRRKKEAVLCFEWSDRAAPKIVVEAHAKYKGISGLLDAHPQVLDLVHGDLKKLSSDNRQGRGGEYTSEHILRALIVKTVEGDSFRDVVVRTADNGFLCDFLRLGNEPVMDFTFLNKCFKAIQPQTWKAITQVLGQRAQAQGWLDASAIRLDSTVVEANIHYPTDSSLLWDSWRVLTRLLREARAAAPWLVGHRFHDKKVKTCHLFITRYASSGSRKRKRAVKSSARKLIGKVSDVTRMTEGFCSAVEDVPWAFELQGIADEMRRFLPSVRVVVCNAQRVLLDGETVPAKERVFSIFEPHVELIKRGKRSKPVEFGHSVLL